MHSEDTVIHDYGYACGIGLLFRFDVNHPVLHPDELDIPAGDSVLDDGKNLVRPAVDVDNIHAFRDRAEARVAFYTEELIMTRIHRNDTISILK